MSEHRPPGPPTRDEEAPLLQDPDRDHDDEHVNGVVHVQPTLAQRLGVLAQEPLTPLSRALLLLSLVLLLLSSVFIGLFAGAQYKLNHGGGEPSPPVTVTSTATATKTVEVTTTAAPPVPTTPPPKKFCVTPGCVSLSTSVLQSLDTTQDPCEDFYQFANGGWLDSHDFPPGSSRYGTFNKLAIDNKNIIRKLLESNSTPSDPPSYDDQILSKVRTFYRSCMDEDEMDLIGSQPIVSLVQTLRNIYRGQRTLQSGTLKRQSGVDMNMTAAISFLHSRGIPGLFDMIVDGDSGNDPNKMVIWFSQPELGLPSKEYYYENDTVKLYSETLQRILYDLDETKQGTPALTVWPPWPWPPWGDDDGSKENATAKAERLANGVIEFEKKIANVSLDLEVLQGDPFGTYNPTPYQTFSKEFSQFSLPDYLSSFSVRAFPTYLILTSTTFPADLSAILNETKSDILEAYFVSRAAFTFADALGKKTEIWKAVRELQETLQGIKKGQVQDRSEFCGDQVEDALGFATGRYFVQKTFPGQSKSKGTKVITDIVAAFKEVLKGIEWMDEKSAKAASEKADAIRVKVGYPLSPNTTDALSIFNYYRSVNVNEKTFFENVLSSSISDKSKAWQKLGRTRDLENWEMFPTTVNAYFNPPANEIVFPAGILRPPFFSQDWPAYFAYGAFGMVAAHELTHAFDSAGRLYNQHGKLERWWTNATSEAYDKRAACIVKQYSNYTIDDGKGGRAPVNGNLTIGENIGDSGLTIAYRAWKAQLQESGQDADEFLPALDYTREQMFFIASAQIWAQLIKPGAAFQRVRTDPHSPNQFRVQGTLSNIPEFATAFKCSPTSKMNPPPEKQCRLWG